MENAPSTILGYVTSLGLIISAFASQYSDRLVSSSMSFEPTRHFMNSMINCCTYRQNNFRGEKIRETRNATKLVPANTTLSLRRWQLSIAEMELLASLVRMLE